MKTIEGIGLADVQAVYSGAEGDLWELIMGQQIHIGGFASSMTLAERAGISQGMRGVDLCCCNGGGMRFLVRFRGVSAMDGVDATEEVVERGRRRCADEGLSGRITFHLRDACDTGLPSGMADFAWGEDAWCYVQDKNALIREAARLVKPGGIVAFTDWIEGPAGLSAEESDRFLRFMKFPSLASLGDYRELLEGQGCGILAAEDTGEFAPHVDLYLNMLTNQLASDALRIIGYDQTLMEGLGAEMVFMQGLARAGKIAQGLFVARKG